MTMDPEAVERAERIAGMLRGYFVAQAVFVAARLGIADLLAVAEEGGEGGSIEFLAQSTGSHAGALYRVLRALAAEGLFEESADGRFRNTPLSTMLRSDVPGSMRAAALLAGETQYKVWALFKDAVRHGTPGFDRIFRQSLFPFLDEHADVSALFNQAMTQQVARARDAVVAACDVRPGETVVDVGGGLGSVLAAILDKHPDVRGVLLEGERVIAQAREALAASPIGERIRLVAGDFLKSVPRGEVMVLASILHMFLDPDAERILKNCRAAMPAGGRIYLVEKLVCGRNQPDPAKWDDLNMLVMTGGRERTFDEFASLLKEAGFAAPDSLGDHLLAAQAI